MLTNLPEEEHRRAMYQSGICFGPLMRIKKIIVGPHREQAALEDTASKLVFDLGLNVAVKCSETPYIGGKSAIGVTA